MTLLAPWAAAIAGALGGSALLLFYLLKLRRRPVRVSSILYWRPMARDQEANVPLRMLRPTLLLLLQALIVALLALALGRPAISGGFGGASGVVVIVDHSASMAAPGAAAAPGGREAETALDEAKREARRIVDDAMRSGASAMIVALGAEARPLTAMSSDRAALRRAIDAIGQTDQPARLAEAERLLGAMTDVADEEEPPSLAAAFITDGQRAPGERPLMPPGVIARERRVGAPEPPPNAGIIGIAARRDYQDPAQVRVFARFAASAAGPERVVVSLLLDGEALDRRTVSIDPQGAATTFELRRTGAATVAVTIEGEDAIASDNGAALRLRPAPGARVLLVVPEGELIDDTRRSPVWLIAEVLQAMDLRGVDIVRASRYEQLARDGDLGAWDAVVFDRVAPQAAPPLPSLSFGATIPDAGWDIDAAAPPSRVLSWRREHPVLRDISLDTVQIGAGALQRAGSPTVPGGQERAGEAGAGEGGGGAAGIEGEELAIGRAGPLIVLVEQAGRRRIIVGFEPAASSWPRQVGFPVFIADALDFITLRGEAEAGGSFTTAEPVRLRLAGEEEARGDGSHSRAAPLLRGPADITGRIVPHGAGLVADFGLVERAGVYRLSEPIPGDETIAAVNLANEAETRLARAEPPEQFPRPQPAEAGEAAAATGAREIWHWFALAALGLSLVEWALSVWGSRW